MNQTSIIYTGPQNSVIVYHKRRRFLFKSRVPKLVDDEVAERFLKMHTFARADETEAMVESHTEGTVVLRRSGAMGDLLMLRAAASAVKRTYPGLDLVLRCQPALAHLFAADPVWSVWPIGQAKPKKLEGAAVVSLDQVVEVDHRGKEVHRVELFMKAMTNDAIALVETDWVLPVPADVARWVDAWLGKRRLRRAERTLPLVALQVRGSGPMKSLPREQVEAISRRLESRANVVLIEAKEEHVWGGDRIYQMTGRDALHALELLRHVDLTVCFDSGVLWMAHCAPSPVLAILGPTRPEQRISLHPRFPDGAHSVSLNDLIVLDGKTGCPPCFERAEACRGSYACMQRQPMTVVDHICDAAFEALGLPRLDTHGRDDGASPAPQPHQGPDRRGESPRGRRPKPAPVDGGRGGGDRSPAPEDHDQGD